MIDDGNKRFYRRCDEFAICVNIGMEGYVTAESPDDRNTIFQYIVYGRGKAGIMFTEDHIKFKAFVIVVFETSDSFVLVLMRDFFIHLSKP